MEETVTKIIYPSDFKIKITNLKDSAGTVIPLANYPYIKFVIADSQGGFYEAIYDPSGNKSINTETTDGYVYVLIQKYNLQGNLKMKIGTQTSDEAFDDNVWKSFGPFIETNIKIVKE